MKFFFFILVFLISSCTAKQDEPNLDFIDNEYFSNNSFCDSLRDEYGRTYFIEDLIFEKKIDTLKNGDLEVLFYFKTKNDEKLFFCKYDSIEIENVYHYKHERNQYTLVQIEISTFSFKYPNLSQLDTIVNNYFNEMPYDTMLFNNWISKNYRLSKKN